jgi:hypothetical protein
LFIVDLLTPQWKCNKEALEKFRMISSYTSSGFTLAFKFWNRLHVFFSVKIRRR